MTVLPEPYTHGALPLPDGRTRFRLWAPSAPADLALVIEGRVPIALQADADGYAQVDVNCEPGARYRYRIGQDLLVPDPASRLQDGDVHGASVVVGPDTYPWRHASWMGRPWREAVIYEAHPGLAGGFAGLTERLPELARLGITVLELMPIADFPGPRNWGYDGVLPYAPDTAYGTPDELKRLIDTAHGLGLCVMLDVVYNHFGPDGNYLSQYAAPFFRDDVSTPWGAAIDFRQPAVRRYFEENALYWLTEYRFDGLRLDAVHAITDPDWLVELARFVRGQVPAQRHLHLVLENDDNRASLLTDGYDAQWNDDAHHVLHHLLTGESRGYYADYAEQPAQALARCLAEGWLYQGQPSRYRQGAARGEPSGHLPPTAFVLFLQNHDQTGNRAWGERLTELAENAERLRAAVTLQLLAPQIPLIFMGEESGSRAPFLYFTSHTDPALAQAVREGRQREFAAFPEFAGANGEPVPDPNAETTWQKSSPWSGADNPEAQQWRDLYRALLDLRLRLIAPRMNGARNVFARAVGDHSVHARWRLGDGALLTAYINLGPMPAALPRKQATTPPLFSSLLFESRAGAFDALSQGSLCSESTVWLLEDAA
ncbi:MULTISPECIES: malto-oligosyltrehalose trehalohydrolase [Achromobacter]|uniref:Malto-oligosyltrehalose trehalohydrolase n=1 Tax=Achromobacter spanius TaxID=217203 RepID=A0ABY8GWS3_9BURK|nr:MULTISPECIES: malto-oligosyltrehalose trehalohydrolase [Achromobacter]WAI81569.1 malto-oligosyltrehalose trehalohydrolase [Achromobacter spanius]WEX97086.1 malto-oligosyltrehalose trehalohydrolase [Achromobacter sp. SS2-2022]WFP09197.1 malto-oligosyltrehalose trehalohydrolase [Achromobacter spanius]